MTGKDLFPDTILGNLCHLNTIFNFRSHNLTVNKDQGNDEKVMSKIHQSNA